MSKRVVANKELLAYLSKCNKVQRKSLVSNATPEEIATLCECVLNVYKKNVPVSNKTYRELKPFKQVLHKCLNKKLSIKKKKQVLQRGGGAFIPILLSAVLPYLLSKI